MGVEERAILGAVIGVCQRAPRRPRSKEVSEKLPSHWSGTTHRPLKIGSRFATNAFAASR